MTTSTEPQQLWTRDALAQHLELAVLPEAHRTGEPLRSERALSEALGVSRSLVREVLRGLEQRGLIEILPGKGAYACDPGVTDAARVMRDVFVAEGATRRHLNEALAALETQTAALAATRATDQEVAAMARALHDLETANGLVAKASADIAFHSLIARASGNPMLVAMFGSVSTLMFESMLRSLANRGTVTQGADDHYRALLDALRRRDPLMAAEAMSAHVEAEEGAYGDDPDERLDGLVRDLLRRNFGQDVPLEEIVQNTLRQYVNGEGEERAELR